MLFADDIIDRSDRGGSLASARQHYRAYLVLGAQGPDIFYHNQRRKPSGLAYGSLMHRRGYGTAVAHMWKWSRDQGLGTDSWAAAWIVGFASHAILDRHTHPYINARSGWVEAGKPETERFRSMHPFLERLVDVELLRLRNGKHPNDVDFFTQSNCGEAPPPEWVELMSYALRNTYRKGRDDDRLDSRLRSAYLDTTGFYRFTNCVDAAHLREGLAREKRGDVGDRWLSIVHPPTVPGELDVLNRGHHPWTHPCSSREVHHEGFEELYQRAVDEGASMIDRMVRVWNRQDDEAFAEIEAVVANWNLSDGRQSERPCTKHHATPLPLREAQDELRRRIRDGEAGGRLCSP